ncbi:MAG: hypothetical protein JRJ69_00545 [Deltaproteobacteria bacterium]|nr:hypothetical protein [Deltaproteobacteria bacterium]
MGINLLLGMNIRDTKYFQTLKAFVVGQEAGATECRTITEKEFSDWTDFQKYISSSDKCTGLIELATIEASNAIQRLM